MLLSDVGSWQNKGPGGKSGPFILYKIRVYQQQASFGGEPPLNT